VLVALLVVVLVLVVLVLVVLLLVLGRWHSRSRVMRLLLHRRAACAVSWGAVARAVVRRARLELLKWTTWPLLVWV
jgi:uncharacterized membrane protein YcaP (DUF421 family)